MIFKRKVLEVWGCSFLPAVRSWGVESGIVCLFRDPSNSDPKITSILSFVIPVLCIHAFSLFDVVRNTVLKGFPKQVWDVRKFLSMLFWASARVLDFYRPIGRCTINYIQEQLQYFSFTKSMPVDVWKWVRLPENPFLHIIHEDPHLSFAWAESTTRVGSHEKHVVNKSSCQGENMLSFNLMHRIQIISSKLTIAWSNHLTSKKVSLISLVLRSTVKHWCMVSVEGTLTPTV